MENIKKKRQEVLLNIFFDSAIPYLGFIRNFHEHAQMFSYKDVHHQRTEKMETEHPCPILANRLKIRHGPTNTGLCDYK